MEEALEKFEQKYNEYVTAYVAYIELNPDKRNYVDFKDEVEWVKNYIRENFVPVDK